MVILEVIQAVIMSFPGATEVSTILNILRIAEILVKGCKAVYGRVKASKKGKGDCLK